jgi:hypothetical protein
MNGADEHLERVLAASVAGLLQGQPNGVDGVALGLFFAELLADQEGWSPYWWVDDAHVEDYFPLDASSVELWGVFHPADKHSRHYWMSPFRAIVRLNDSREGFADFEVWLGEAGANLNSVAYEDRRPRHWPRVKAWRYHFRAE